MKVFVVGMSFAKEIFRQANKQTIVHPILSKDYPTKAKKTSKLKTSKKFYST